MMTRITKEEWLSVDYLRTHATCANKTQRNSELKENKTEVKNRLKRKLKYDKKHFATPLY